MPHNHSLLPPAASFGWTVEAAGQSVCVRRAADSSAEIMLTYKKALELAESYVRIISDDQFVVVTEHTVKRPYGWVFFYQSRKYLASGNFSDRLAGNGPFLIERVNNEIRVFGTGKNLESSLAEYEAGLPVARLQMGMPKEP